MSGRKCMSCDLPVPLIASHVVSNFLRNAIFGKKDVDEEGNIIEASPTRHQFTWVAGPADGRGRFAIRSPKAAQNLPTLPLMCAKCDTFYGDTLERPVAAILRRSGSLSDPMSFYHAKCLGPPSFDSLGGKTHKGHWMFGEYEWLDSDQEHLINRFVVLTCWRALHSMAMTTHPALTRYLISARGSILQSEVKRYLQDEPNGPNGPTHHVCLFLPAPPLLMDVMGDVKHSMPFGWGYLEDSGTRGVVVWAGLWLMVWIFDLGGPDGFFRIEPLVVHAATRWPPEVLKRRIAQQFTRGGTA